MQNPAARSRRRPSAVGGAGSGGREDCWSEDATETLVEAWGDRYLQLNRGNLRQNDWKEIADAVNGRHAGVQPRKTDIQCKNRIDTVKKKFKLEKTKPPPSKWPFFTRLQYLIGSNVVTASAASKKLTTVKFTVNPSKTVENPNRAVNRNVIIFSGGSSSKSRLNSIGSTESSLDDEDEDEFLFGGGLKRNRIDSVDVSDKSAFRELARAILRFGEIYERTEGSKQQQMMEIEKQKMEFTKDLEFQRMNMFMDAQLELEKMKRQKHTASSGKKL